MEKSWNLKQTANFFTNWKKKKLAMFVGPLIMDEIRSWNDRVKVMKWSWIMHVTAEMCWFCHTYPQPGVGVGLVVMSSTYGQVLWVLSPTPYTPSCTVLMPWHVLLQQLLLLLWKLTPCNQWSILDIVSVYSFYICILLAQFICGLYHQFTINLQWHSHPICTEQYCIYMV